MKLTLFTKHPEEVNETYISHLFNAAKISIKLGIACPMQMLHAVFPFICPPMDSSVDSLIEYLNSMHPEERKKCSEK